MRWAKTPVIQADTIEQVAPSPAEWEFHLNRSNRAGLYRIPLCRPELRFGLRCSSYPCLHLRFLWLCPLRGDGLPHHLSIPFVRLVRVKSSSLQGLPTFTRNPVSHRRAAVLIFHFHKPPIRGSDFAPFGFRRRQFCGAASLLRVSRCRCGCDTTRRFRNHGCGLGRGEPSPHRRFQESPSLRMGTSHALKPLNRHGQPFLGRVICKFYRSHAPNIRFPDHIARNFFRSKPFISRSLRFHRDFLCDFSRVPNDFLPRFPRPSHVRRAVRPSIPRARESRRPGFPLPGECVPPALRAALITDAHRVDLVVVIAPRPVELLHRL